MKTKFNQFISRLEEKQLAGTQESLVLTNSNDFVFFGGHKNKCIANTSRCDETTPNGGQCSNKIR